MVASRKRSDRPRQCTVLPAIDRPRSAPLAWCRAAHQAVRRVALSREGSRRQGQVDLEIAPPSVPVVHAHAGCRSSACGAVRAKRASAGRFARTLTCGVAFDVGDVEDAGHRSIIMRAHLRGSKPRAAPERLTSPYISDCRQRYEGAWSLRAMAGEERRVYRSGEGVGVPRCTSRQAPPSRRKTRVTLSDQSCARQRPDAAELTLDRDHKGEVTGVTATRARKRPDGRSCCCLGPATHGLGHGQLGFLVCRSASGCRDGPSGHGGDESVQFHPQPVGERLGVGA